MTLTQKTTHIAEAKARLVTQFQGKPNIEALVGVYVTQIQELETIFFQLLLNRALDTSEGVQLDGLGAIVGEERKGKIDAVYVLYIKARMLANRSSGQGEFSIAILKLLTSNTFEYLEWFPAAWSIVLSDALAESPTALAELLSKAAGVRSSLEYTLVDDDVTFTFATGDTAETDADRGFAGPNLFLNPDFDNWAFDDPDDWNVSGESAPNREVSEVGSAEGHGGVGAGSANIYSDSATGIELNQLITIVVGKSYEVRFQVTKLTVSPLHVYEDEANYFEEVLTAEGVYSYTFVATTPEMRIVLENNVAAVDATVDVFTLTTGGAWADAVGVS